MLSLTLSGRMLFVYLGGTEKAEIGWAAFWPGLQIPNLLRSDVLYITACTS